MVGAGFDDHFLYQTICHPSEYPDSIRKFIHNSTDDTDYALEQIERANEFF